MGLTREQAHLLIDKLFDGGEFVEDSQLVTRRAEVLEEAKEAIEEFAPEAPARVLPEGKRVVRTKNSGDRVYMLDEVKKTRHWVTNPEVLKGLGFELEDVTEVDDAEMLRYQMAAALYRVE